MNENEKSLEQREKNLKSQLLKLEQREKSLSFRKKMLCFFFLLELVLLAFILYSGQSFFSNKTNHDIDVKVSQEAVQNVPNEEKQTRDLLAAIESDSNFGKFVRKEAWEAIDFVNEPDIASSYRDMSCFSVKNGTLLVNPQQITKNIMDIAKNDTLEITEDRKKFRFDLQDSEVWDMDIIRKSCISLNELKPGVGKYTYDNAKNHLSGILRDAENKKSDQYGYIRFFFKTSLDSVYIMRAYSLDVTKRPQDYLVLDSFSKYKAVDNLAEKIEQQRQYDGEFRTLSFSFLQKAPSLTIETLELCLNEFFSQLLSES